MFQRLKLLIWKNYKKQIIQKHQFRLSILSPILFSLIVVIMRNSIKLEQNINLLTFRKIDTIEELRKLLYNIKNRHDIFRRNGQDFTSSVYVPEITVAYAPDNQAAFNTIMNNAFEKFNTSLKIISFLNCKDMKDTMSVIDYLYGICFEDSNNFSIIGVNGVRYPMLFDFKIVMPPELRIYEDNYVGYSWNTHSNFDSNRFKAYGSGSDGGSPGYIREGFAGIQHLISASYIKLAGVTEQVPNVLMQRFDIRKRNNDIFCIGFHTSIAIIFIVGYMYPIFRLLNNIVEERQNNQNYLLNINGVSKLLQLLSWYINGLLPLLLCTIIVVILLDFEWLGVSNVMPRVSNLIIFCFFISYIISALAFTLFLSVIWRNTKTALALMPFIWIIVFLPFMSKYDDTFRIHFKKLAKVLLFNVTLSVGIQNMLHLELYTTEMSTKEYLSVRVFNKSEPLYMLIVAFYIQTMLYFLLACIIESGVCLSFWHTCKKCVLRKKSHKDDGDGDDDDDFELQSIKGDKPLGKEVVLELKNIYLKYSKRTIIKNFSLCLHKNETVCILGNNTTGKSTIMKIICGLLKPTSGSVYINGHNIANNPYKAYKNVGFALPSVKIFEEFTVVEQLKFFCQLRGLTAKETQEEVEHYLEALDIKKLSKVRTDMLSAGQLQLLIVLCAFIGRTKIVLLDKPFVGIDIYAKNLLLKFLELQKINRAILITTRSCKITEYISDRLAIITYGELTYMGTYQSLHKNYKDGYRLICQRRDGCNAEELTQYFAKYIPSIQKETDIGNTTTYRIEYEEIENLMKLTDVLHTNRFNLYINSYRVTQCNFYFLQNSAYMQSIGKGIDNYKDVLHHIEQDIQQVDSIKLSLYRKRHLGGIKLFISRMMAVTQKLFIIDVRYPLLPFLQMFLPTMMAVLVFVFPHYSSERHINEYKLTFIPNSFPECVIIYNVTDDLSEAFEQYCRSTPHDHRNVMANDSTIMHTVNRIMDSQHIFHDLRIIAGLNIKQNFSVAWFNNYLMHAAPLSLNVAFNIYARKLVDENINISVSLDLLPFTTNHFSMLTRGIKKHDNVLILALTFCFCYLWSFPLLTLVSKNVNYYNKLENMAGMHFISLGLVKLLYDFSKTLLCFVPFNSVIYAIHYHKLMQPDILVHSISSILICALCVLSFNILLIELLSDAHSGYLLIITVHSVGVVIFIAFFELDEMRNPEESSKLPYVSFLPYYMLPRILVRLIAFLDIRDSCADEDTRDISIYLEKCHITPNCCDLKKPSFIEDVKPFLIITILIWIIYILIKKSHFIKNLIVSRDSFFGTYPDNRLEEYLTHFTVMSNQDRSTMIEKVNVQTLERNLLVTKPLYCRNISVRLANKIIFHRLSFMIERYQKFAVLGKNGSGKSVLLATILGDYPIISGEIHIQYAYRSSNVGKTYNRIGFCPPEEAIIEGLTILETISYVMTIRGVSQKLVDINALDICKVFGIYKYRHYILNKCGSGTKKRVSIALAMIGHASLILLDEPFAALDEVSKHLMFNIIDTVCEHGQSVMISCADPDECELVNRVAILQDREFRAVGEYHQLLPNFDASYFIVTLKLCMARFNKVAARRTYNFEQLEQNAKQKSTLKYNMSAFVEEILPEAVIKDITCNVLSCWVSKLHYSFSKVLAILHEYSNWDYFYDFSISMPTMDGMFKRLASEKDRGDALSDQIKSHLD